MPLFPPQSYRKVANIHRRGLASARPAAADVLPGTLYFSTNTGVIERSTGSAWESFSGNSSVSSSGNLPYNADREEEIDNFFIDNNPIPSSGVYTPTLTNAANLDASTAYVCQYLRVNNIVMVSGKVDVNPTLAATSTGLGISLPIASNFGATEDCCGAAFASGIAGQGAAILADSINDRAQMQWIAGDLTNQAMYFSFIYRII